jgi:hypothetical protein
MHQKRGNIISLNDRIKNEETREEKLYSPAVCTFTKIAQTTPSIESRGLAILA